MMKHVQKHSKWNFSSEIEKLDLQWYQMQSRTKNWHSGNITKDGIILRQTKHILKNIDKNGEKFGSHGNTHDASLKDRWLFRYWMRKKLLSIDADW